MAPLRHSKRERHAATLYQAPVVTIKRKSKKNSVAKKSPSGRSAISKAKSNVKSPKALGAKKSHREPTAERLANDKIKADRLLARLLRGKLPDNDKLTPRKHITVLEKNPQFETNARHPFVSVVDQARMGVRAVNLADAALLKKLAADTRHVPADFVTRSSNMVSETTSALHRAVEKHDFKMYDTLLETAAKLGRSDRARVVEERSLLEKVTTGRSNFAMLGRHTRKVEMTRGGREGNNALIKTAPTTDSCVLNHILTNGVPNKFLDQAIAKKHIQYYLLQQSLPIAARMGHRSLVAHVVNDTHMTYPFNALHKQVVTNTKGEALAKFMPVSVKKKALNMSDMTPMHFACINEDDRYVRELMAVEHDYNHPDRLGMRAIHYACVCSGPRPLLALLERGASVYDVDKRGRTPLMHAVLAGRTHNVDVLATYMTTHKRDINDDGVVENDLGAYVRQKDNGGECAMHMAVPRGDTKMMDALLKHGADVDARTSAGNGKLNAVMLASQTGLLGVVRHLVGKCEAKANERDKLKRSFFWNELSRTINDFWS